MFSPLPFHPLTLIISLLFPLTLPSSHPQYPYPFISIFPISPYPLILFPISHPLTFPISPHSSLIPSHPPYNRVQSTYTDLTPSAACFPTSTHTRSANHVVRSCIHTLTLSYSLIMFHTALCST